ncbi:putative tRNA methyltransferase TRM10-type domain-containing protein [Helianthus debilis subsp. tardiflorus]
MMIELGYMDKDLDVLKYYFRVPGKDIDFGLRPIGSDVAILRLNKHATVTKVVELYVEKVQKMDLGDWTHEPLSVTLPRQRQEPQHALDLGDLTQAQGCGGNDSLGGGDDSPGGGDDSEGNGDDSEGEGDGSSHEVQYEDTKDSEDREFNADDELSEEDIDGSMNANATKKKTSKRRQTGEDSEGSLEANATKKKAYKKRQTKEDGNCYG